MRTHYFSVTFTAAAAIVIASGPGAAPAATVNEEIKVVPADTAEADFFGDATAVSGLTAILGASGDDDNGPASGSAYLYNAVFGTQTFKLLASDGATFDLFGTAVGIDGTTAVVGAPGISTTHLTAGAAYLFDTTTGAQLFKLTATDGAIDDKFGISVGVRGTTAIVGAGFKDDNGADSGAAYLFDATTGLQLFKLSPTDGAAGDRFGAGVAIDGTTAIVGADGDDDNGADSGAAYLFDTKTGTQLFKLLPADGAAGDRFGASVDISGAIAIVGAGLADANGVDSGAAYIFDTTTGVQIAKITPDDAAAGDWFGGLGPGGVAISETTAVIAAVGASPVALRSGTAYLFDLITGQQLAKFVPSDGAADDLFGTAAISGVIAIVGASSDDDACPGGDAANCPFGQGQSGSAYFFNARICAPTTCSPADINGDGVVDTADLGVLIGAFGTTCP